MRLFCIFYIYNARDVCTLPSRTRIKKSRVGYTRRKQEGNAPARRFLPLVKINKLSAVGRKLDARFNKVRLLSAKVTT